MPTFVIEREMPDAGKLSEAELAAISRKSCSVVSVMAPRIEWLESYVTADKIYCIYRAADEAAIREHAAAGGFPANRIARIRCTIDPGTAE